MARGNMRGQLPGGEGEVLTATELLNRARRGDPAGTRIALNPGGGEYQAVIIEIAPAASPSGWVRLLHRRDGMRPTINVVPPSTQVRILE